MNNNATNNKLRIVEKQQLLHVLPIFYPKIWDLMVHVNTMKGVENVFIGVPFQETVFANGSWTGAFGMLQREEADAIISFEIMNEEKFRIADFVTSEQRPEIVMVYPIKKKEIFRDILEDMIFESDFNIWICLVCTVSLMHFAIWLLKRDFEKIKKLDYVNDAWFRRYNIFYLLQFLFYQGIAIAPTFASLRIFFITFIWFSAFFVMNIFALTKTSMMATDSHSIEAFSELEERTDVALLFENIGHVQELVQYEAAVDSECSALGRKIQNKNTLRGSTHYQQLRNIFSGEIAVVGEATSISSQGMYFCPKGTPHRLYARRYEFMSSLCAHSIRKTAPHELKKKWMRRIIYAQETGLYAYALKNILEWPWCIFEKLSTESADMEPFKLNVFMKTFAFYLAGLKAALVCFVLERITAHCIQP